MQLYVFALLFSIVVALPIFSNIKRDVQMMELPEKSGIPCIEFFRNACIGIAVCNPVTVAKGGSATAPDHGFCFGIADCNPVTVSNTTTTGTPSPTPVAPPPSDPFCFGISDCNPVTVNN